MSKPSLQEQFGQIDIYLFDQLLKGRIVPGMRILDAGCGGGRNIVYFLREGYQVCGVDVDSRAVEGVRALARKLQPALSTAEAVDHFRVEPVEAMSFAEGCADVVICSAVLHFAHDDTQFERMVTGCWRVLKPGGLLFARLGSTIGVEAMVERIVNGNDKGDQKSRRYKSPDGSERYLVDEELLLQQTARLGGELADPIKTTVVQNLRAMTTWVLWKRR